MEDINWIALVVAALAAWVVGAIWYNPKVFGKAWMAETGMTEEKAKQGNMPMIMGLTLLMAFVVAFFLNYLVNHGGEEFQTFKHGAMHGSMAALMTAVPALVTNALYEQKSLKYVLINAGYWIVSFAVIGAIVNVWH